MKTIRIPQGNEFSLFVPLVLKDGTAVEGERLSDIQVLLQSAPPRQSYAVSVNVQSNYVVVTPQVELPLGSYDLTITAKYEGRDIAILLNNCFAISTWTNGSDYEKYLVGEEIVLEQQVLIGAFNTDAELETLKEQYRTAIAAAQAAQAEAEAAKETFDEKAEQLEDVAQETTSQEIKQDVADVKEAVENIDFSELAKQGTNANATNTAILEAAENAATDAAAAKVAAQATAALNSEVSAGKQAIVDAINQMGGSATASMTLAQLGQQIKTLQILSNDVTFTDGTTMPVNISDYLGVTPKNIVKIVNSSKTNSIGTSLDGNSSLVSVEFSRITSLEGYALRMCSNLVEAKFPNVSSLIAQTFRYDSNLLKVNLLRLSSFGAGYDFDGCNKLIDITIGAGIVSSVNFSNFRLPVTNFVTTSSSLCFDTDQEEYGQTFSNNFDKWKWCIINHFAANLQDRTGLTAYTITFGSAILNKFDSDMTTAFTSKNWTLA